MWFSVLPVLHVLVTTGVACYCCTPDRSLAFLIFLVHITYTVPHPPIACLPFSYLPTSHTRWTGYSTHGRRFPKERVSGEGARCRPCRPDPSYRGPCLPPPVRRAAPGRRGPYLSLVPEPSWLRHRRRNRDRRSRSASAGPPVVGHERCGFSRHILEPCFGERRGFDRRAGWGLERSDYAVAEARFIVVVVAAAATCVFEEACSWENGPAAASGGVLLARSSCAGG